VAGDAGHRPLEKGVIHTVQRMLEPGCVLGHRKTHSRLPREST
jgi:hypothetical protein